MYKENIKKNIGILYVCTGKYAVFFDKFYKSCEKYFLCDTNKKYYVWTDSYELIEKYQCNNIIFIYQEMEKWPFPTLNRYSYFTRDISIYEESDYLIFMNANMIVKKNIYFNDLFIDKNRGLFATLHPGFFDKSPIEYTYERNKKSLAYIKKGDGKYYFAGGFNGGIKKAFISMSRSIEEQIREDLKNGIIAIWHDESHLNRYLLNRISNVNIISPSYLFPEEVDIPFEKKIILIDKNRIGGHNHLRGIE